MKELFTIGHSTHTIDRFMELLSIHGITAVCDVRSQPYSKFNPQFNRETLQSELKRHGIAYVYLGKELGPRSVDPSYYENSRVRYDLLAKTDLFQEGLRRVREGMKTHRIALMCAEKDPIMCHRTILVSRRLADKDIRVRHILEDGSIEENEDAMKRLMNLLKLPEQDLFTPAEGMIERAYDIQGEKIAYVQDEGGHSAEKPKGE